MGWIFRKALNFGPLRVTLSKTGASFSIGAKGFRAGVNSRGRTYTSVGIPGTGLRYQKFFKK